MTKQDEYAQRRKAEGMVKLTVWVPAEDYEATRKYAERKRNAYRRRKS